MEKLLDEIESYWSTRTEGYSEVNHKELAGTQKNAWLKVLTSQFPDKPKEEIRILDIGTGPGFFPVILAEAGYHVDAVDYTEGMLEKAKENAGDLCRNIRFLRMDAQKLDFEDNIRETRRVADVAAALDIPCEAELGKVGGKEDDLEAEADTNTDPQEAKEFVERTGVTSLAVAIGTAHGFYVGTPVLDKERLSEIREVVDIPLVLHGASGLSDEDVMDCVKRGICKVNFATELRAAYSKAVKELLAEKPDTIDPKAYGKTAIAAVKELVMARMKVCGCDGKAE